MKQASPSSQRLIPNKLSYEIMSAAKEIAINGTLMAGSFDFSFMVVLLGAYAAALAEKGEGGEDYIAASTVIISNLNMCVYLSIAPLFSIGVYASPLRGELQALKEWTLILHDRKYVPSDLDLSLDKFKLNQEPSIEKLKFFVTADVKQYVQDLDRDELCCLLEMSPDEKLPNKLFLYQKDKGMSLVTDQIGLNGLRLSAADFKGQNVADGHKDVLKSAVEIISKALEAKLKAKINEISDIQKSSLLLWLPSIPTTLLGMTFSGWTQTAWFRQMQKLQAMHRNSYVRILQLYLPYCVEWVMNRFYLCLVKLKLRCISVCLHFQAVLYLRVYCVLNQVI